MTRKGYWKLGRKHLLPETSIAAHLPRVEHIGVQVDMTMIGIATKEVDMITGMAMGGKEMDIEKMTDTVVLEIRPTGMEIVILGILMNATGKMNTEEVIATLSMQKDRAAGATGMRRLIHPVVVAATLMRLLRIRGLLSGSLLTSRLLHHRTTKMSQEIPRTIIMMKEMERVCLLLHQRCLLPPFLEQAFPQSQDR